MVKIRLSQLGRKNRHSYRIVVMDAKSKRDGRYIEKIGHYVPYEDSKNSTINKERYDYWVSVGAQPTPSVRKLVNGTYVYKFSKGKANEPETVEENDIVVEEVAKEEKAESTVEPKSDTVADTEAIPEKDKEDKSEDASN